MAGEVVLSFMLMLGVLMLVASVALVILLLVLTLLDTLGMLDDPTGDEEGSG